MPPINHGPALRGEIRRKRSNEHRSSGWGAIDVAARKFRASQTLIVGEKVRRLSMSHVAAFHIHQKGRNFVHDICIK